ncbi:MAG: NAD(P)H-binding protein, partial [Acidobacteriota bacterium]
MGSKTVVLVTGATGIAGAEVCAQLATIPSVEVRATLHSVEKRRFLPESVSTVPFEAENPASVDAAFEGVDKLFLLTPGGPPGPPATRAIMDAAQKHGVSRIVKLSSIAPELQPQAPTDLWALEAEAMVKDSGIPYTFLRPPWFNQNFTRGYFAPMVMQHVLALPFGDGVTGWIDTRDIAAVAAVALMEDGHAGQAYTLTGPAAISLSDIAGILSEVTGHAIHFQHLTDEQWVQAMLAMGRAEVDAHATLALISKTRDGHLPHVTDEVERLTGNKARTF